MPKNCQKPAKAKRDGVINPQNYKQCIVKDWNMMPKDTKTRWSQTGSCNYPDDLTWHRNIFAGSGVNELVHEYTMYRQGSPNRGE